MADRITVSTSEMNACVNRYNTALGTLEDAQKSMKTALWNLEGVSWKGLAWMAMRAKWEELELNIEKAHLAIRRTIMALGNASTSYDEGENENAAKSKGMDPGAASNIYVE